MSNPRPSNPPIERETFQRVLVRVAVKLVVLDYHHRPASYRGHPPTAVLDLASRLRLLFPTFHGPLIFVAKALQQGYRLAEISYLSLEPAPRSLAKRRIRRG